MTKHHHFYSHLVPMDAVIYELFTLDMSDSERVELLAIIQSHLHYTVIDIVLSNLSDEDKKKFLEHEKQNDHVKTLNFVKDRISDIEEQILRAADEIKHEIIKDIRHLKEKEKEKKLKN